MQQNTDVNTNKLILDSSTKNENVKIITNYKNKKLILNDQNDISKFSKLNYQIEHYGNFSIITKNYFKKHIVTPLDSIEKIAQSYNVSVDYLVKNNNLKQTKLYLGQIIYI